MSIHPLPRGESILKFAYLSLPILPFYPILFLLLLVAVLFVATPPFILFRARNAFSSSSYRLPALFMELSRRPGAAICFDGGAHP